MDRLMVYPGAIPLDTDVLSVERNVMKALGWLTQATLGTGTGVVGLACTPTVPASMTVNIGPGALWAQEVIDQTNFGSLPADTSPLMKMGILPEAAGTNFTLTAPSVAGQSITYLIEAAFIEADASPVVLPYVNPSNPAQPYTGPNNTGTAQNTIRAQSIELQLKAGVAANTGTQSNPSVDPGYVGLYLITVNFGQTTISAANITPYPNAPFNTPPFASLAQVQSGSTNYADDSSTTVNQIVVALNPAVTTLVDGMPINFTAANSNNGATQINFGAGLMPLISAAGALQGGEIVKNCPYRAVYNAAAKSVILLGSGGGAMAGAAATQSDHLVNLGQFSDIYPAGSATLVGIPGNTPTGLSQITVKSPCAGLIFALGCLNISYQQGASYSVALSINGTIVSSTAGYTSQSVSGVVPVSAGVNTIQVTTNGIQTGSNIMLSVIFIPNVEQAL